MGTSAGTSPMARPLVTRLPRLSRSVRKLTLRARAPVRGRWPLLSSISSSTASRIASPASSLRNSRFRCRMRKPLRRLQDFQTSRRGYLGTVRCLLPQAGWRRLRGNLSHCLWWYGRYTQTRNPRGKCPDGKDPGRGTRWPPCAIFSMRYYTPLTDWARHRRISRPDRQEPADPLLPGNGGAAAGIVTFEPEEAC